MELKPVMFDDWLWDVHWLPKESAAPTESKKPAPKDYVTKLALCFGHNTVTLWDWPSRQTLSLATCTDQCILYPSPVSLFVWVPSGACYRDCETVLDDNVQKEVVKQTLAVLTKQLFEPVPVCVFLPHLISVPVFGFMEQAPFPASAPCQGIAGWPLVFLVCWSVVVLDRRVSDMQGTLLAARGVSWWFQWEQCSRRCCCGHLPTHIWLRQPSCIVSLDMR